MSRSHFHLMDMAVANPASSAVTIHVALWVVRDEGESSGREGESQRICCSRTESRSTWAHR